MESALEVRSFYSSATKRTLGLFCFVLKYYFLLNNNCKVKEKNQQWIGKAWLFSKKASIHVIFLQNLQLLVCISLSCNFSSSVDPPFDFGLKTGN